MALALTIQGIGGILREEARALGLAPATVEFDGRADVVPLAFDEPRLTRLRTAEAVFLHVGDLRRRPSARATASTLASDRVAAALGHIETTDRHRPTFRAVVRVRDEREFTRTALRASVRERLHRLLPGWREGDPADVEFWVLQTTASRYRVGMRLRGLGARREGPRARERHGALRPAAAAAMVRLAGDTHGTLLDPCCGSGSILAESAAVGWDAVGGDIDLEAIAVAAVNTAAPLLRLDSRDLPFAADSAGAVVTNLPFGSQHKVQGLPVAWYRRTLAEAMRVAPVAVVLASPTQPFRQALGRIRCNLTSRHDLSLLGMHTTIWRIDRQR